MKFPFVRPNIPPPARWVPFLDESYSARYFTNFGPVEQRLSTAIAGKFLAGDGSCILCTNATAGLSATLVAMQVEGPVIVPAFTFPASLQAVIGARCEPVLCDVDPVTWELSPDSLQETITAIGRPAAIMPVRVFGFVRDYSGLRSLANGSETPIVVDAAAALGRSQVDLGPNSPPYVEVFSLHATKSFGIGEGGAIFAPSDLKEPIRRALNFGLRPDRTFGYGLNGKMSDIQAAVGLAVINQIDEAIRRRKAMCAFYDDIFAAVPGVRLPAGIGETPSTNYPALMPPDFPTARFSERSLELGLQVRRYYFPSLSKGFTEPVRNPLGTPVSEDLASRMVCFPVYEDATAAEMDEIASILKQTFAEFQL